MNLEDVSESKVGDVVKADKFPIEEFGEYNITTKSMQYVPVTQV